MTPLDRQERGLQPSSPHPAFDPRTAGRRNARQAGRTSLLLMYLYGAWALAVLDLHYFLGNVVAGPLGRIGTVVYIPLLFMIAAQAPSIAASRRTWVLFPSFLALTLSAALAFPGAINLFFAKKALQSWVIYYALAVATLLYVRTARQALPILTLLLGQFAWWALWARLSGQVQWHATLANYDAFGGLAVLGVALCYFGAMASSARRTKRALLALAAYCVVGVVTSFARGAFLSLVVLACYIWLRSPRKLVTAAAGIGGALVMVVAVGLLFSSGAPGGRGATVEGIGFWQEMLSSFSQGTTEGTGGMRWVLWNAAIKVWKAHPIIGVGGGNFGVFAASYFRQGEIPEFPDPNMLWGFDLHNAYFQVLSEFGLLGVTAFVWTMIDFVVKNRALRTRNATRRWREATGGAWDLHALSLALEAANIANFLAGVFYASLFMPWFYTIWTANRLLWALTRSPEARGARGSRLSVGHAVERLRGSPLPRHSGPLRPATTPGVSRSSADR